MLRYCFQKKG